MIKNISLILRLIIAGEKLQNVGWCSALRAFKQGGIFIVLHLLWHVASGSRSNPKDRPNQSPFTTHMECGGPILTQILTWVFETDHTLITMTQANGTKHYSDWKVDTCISVIMIHQNQCMPSRTCGWDIVFFKQLITWNKFHLVN
jgi:hypothetical protein